MTSESALHFTSTNRKLQGMRELALRVHHGAPRTAHRLRGAEAHGEGGGGGQAGFPVHPHMLRRACGYKLANDGHDTRAIQHYLGHRNIQHTTRYTELAPDRFKAL